MTLDTTFNVNRPAVPAHIFLSERDKALNNDGNSERIACDLSGVIGLEGPATTPLLVASYLRLAPGAPLKCVTGASTELYYVIQGRGRTQWADDEIQWQAGDAMILPGGIDYLHESLGKTNSVLWQCTNAPQLKLENARPAPPGESLVAATHYSGDKIKNELAAARATLQADGRKSTALLPSTTSMEKNGTSTPSMTLVVNTVEPGGIQSAHKHNSVAVTLVLQGDKAYSTVNKRQIKWSRYATFVTPPGATHSHHNNHQTDDSVFLIVQDAGLHFHCRTIGFQNVLQ